MLRSKPVILRLTRIALRVIVVLNIVTGVLIFALLVASLLAESQVLVMFAVLLLFVLARVFDHGARMRGDLEGTI
jgi:hypothetical protein